MAQPRPPPRLTGDSRKDLHSMFQWMQGFYEDVVLDEQYTTQSQVNTTVINTVSPTTATAQSAQTTANAAAAKADANEIDIAANKAILDGQESGEFTIENTDLTAVITFATAQADTSYFITFGIAAISGSPAADSYIISSIAKTNDDFTVTLKAAPGAATDITFAWHVTR